MKPALKVVGDLINSAIIAPQLTCRYTLVEVIDNVKNRLDVTSGYSLYGIKYDIIISN